MTKALSTTACMTARTSLKNSVFEAAAARESHW
jgi:hypothetical protein